jgi:hypothetical protein
MKSGIVLIIILSTTLCSGQKIKFELHEIGEFNDRMRLHIYLENKLME